MSPPYMCYDNGVEPKKEAIRRARDMPDPLLSRRPRALTLQIKYSANRRCLIPRKPDSTMIIPKTCEQSQSPLFALFPAELREYIYHYALGRNTFHIIHLRKRLGVVRCREEFIENWVVMSNHPCWGEYYRRQNSYVPELFARPLRDDWGDSRMNGLLALMKTCRRV